MIDPIFDWFSRFQIILNKQNTEYDIICGQ